MISEPGSSARINRWVLLVASALLIQGCANYYDLRILHLGYFRGLDVLIRIPLPFLIGVFGLRLSRREMGLVLPVMNRQRWLILAWLLAACVVAVPIIHFLPSDLRHYGTLIDSGRSAGVRWLEFAAFTVSTLFGWEFLHRGFLLFGMRTLLRNDLKVDEKSARTIAVTAVCIFEVLFHLKKPLFEALGMILASPVLSIVALECESILLPVLIHLWIELLFGSVMIFYMSR